MGLFRKKPKSIIVPRPATPPKPPVDEDASDADIVPTLAPPPAMKLDVASKLETPVPAPAPAAAMRQTHAQLPPLPHKPKPKQNKKAKVDPADFLALRSEMLHLRARLDESEQARALVEARLAAIDAATAAFAAERTDISEVANMVIQLQQEIVSRPVTGETPAVAGSTDGALGEKVDALHSRIQELQDHGAKVTELETQLAQMRAQLEENQADRSGYTTNEIARDLETIEQLAAMQQRIDALDAARQRIGELDYLHQRLSHLESNQAAPQQNTEQLDLIEQRLSAIDALAAQLQQLNARVAAQAELGGQLSALRDRVSQLMDRPDETTGDTSATDELREHMGQLAERMTSYDNEARAVRDHMALLDQRVTNVSTELANQISELGKDIDGLGQRIPDIVDGSVSDEVIDALRGGQVKLANEQARYEIAFRQDLAALAEQLRRGAREQPASS